MQLHAAAVPVWIAVLLSSAGCRRPLQVPVSSTWCDMGTVCTVSVPAADKARLGDVLAVSREEVGRLNALLTVYSPTSEISRVNRNAGVASVPVSSATREVLALSRHYAEMSGGAFDATVGTVVRMWGFNTGTVPDALLSDAVLREALVGLGFARLVLGEQTAYLNDARASIDLGGIAKGYAVDACFKRVRDRCPSGVMINVGGNIRCGGRARPDRPWRVGVRNPFDKDDILGTISLPDGAAVATSGNYERFVTIAGRRYAHIIDPRTGRPVEGMAALTVVSASAVEADALSTALFVLGMDASRDVLKACPDTEALFVPDRNPIEIWVSPGFRAVYESDARYAAAVRVLDW